MLVQCTHQFQFNSILYFHHIKNNKIQNRWRRCNTKAKPEKVWHQLYRTYKEINSQYTQTQNDSHIHTHFYTTRQNTRMSQKQSRGLAERGQEEEEENERH